MNTYCAYDTMNTQGFERLAELVRKHPQIIPIPLSAGSRIPCPPQGSRLFIIGMKFPEDDIMELAENVELIIIGINANQK